MDIEKRTEIRSTTLSPIKGVPLLLFNNRTTWPFYYIWPSPYILLLFDFFCGIFLSYAFSYDFVLVKTIFAILYSLLLFTFAN